MALAGGTAHRQGWLKKLNNLDSYVGIVGVGDPSTYHARLSVDHREPRGLSAGYLQRPALCRMLLVQI